MKKFHTILCLLILLEAEYLRNPVSGLCLSINTLNNVSHDDRKRLRKYLSDNTTRIKRGYINREGDIETITESNNHNIWLWKPGSTIGRIRWLSAAIERETLLNLKNI